MAQTFKASVKPQHERKDYIAAQMAAAGTFYTSYDIYEGTPTQLPIIRVPLGLPLYRMSNGRTQTRQLAHITEKELPVDYFSAGQENDPAQQTQHEILRNLSKEGTESITPIID